ncbi:tRNA (adenine(58)-N(1))-methyltransferase, mitochondrial [Bombina bombina]|uniref:tRNA (adenine(58)-N(1))-methyltransferase, mitochondrial n=1 Tax=Bombina bombina TaxID=8345 RepID=UPI00235A6A7B|nr:tRNA (adenine(58)-N(1))-methyltransferase, mitochondrial [Bombina bombina]
MWQRCVGRVLWLCHSGLRCRLPVLAAGFQCQTQLQHFVSCTKNPGVDESQDGEVVSDDSRGQGDAIGESSKQPTAMPIRRKRAWGTSLSPLHRISQMIPSEFVSEDIKDLRGPEVNLPETVNESTSHGPHTLQWDSSGSKQPPEKEHAVSQSTPFIPGDLVVSEFKRRHYSMFRKMFLLKDSGKLMSNWGVINYSEILGKFPGQKIRTSQGFEFLLKRPSLDDYILLMKRGPTISYPKDITAMMMMMDVSPGDVILEAGSGSGGMSLFLSRSVGPNGCIYSFEIRKDHHSIATKNFWKWKNAWDIQHQNPWPENVYFINKDISDGLAEIKSVSFDAVALDMLNPQVALPAILPNLKQGAVCATYLANITQVIDLLEGIRSCQLPFVCEKIMEISVKEWIVAPSFRKDGSISQRVKPKWEVVSEAENLEQNEDFENCMEDEPISAEVKPFGHIPYIARPMPWQAGHTAFLVQLRKIKPAPKHTAPEEIC